MEPNCVRNYHLEIMETKQLNNVKDYDNLSKLIC